MKGTSAVARLFLLCFVCLLLLAKPAGIVWADDSGSMSVADQLKLDSQKKNGQTAPTKSEDAPLVPSSDGWGLLVQFIFSLGFIILLIYFLLRFLAKRQIGGAGRNGGMKVISSVSVGNGKSMQVVQIGDSLYIVGVGDSISLLRHIEAGDEMDAILADVEIAPTGVGKWEEIFARLRRKPQGDRFEVTEELDTSRSFDEMLGKEWDEVGGKTRIALWDDESKRGKGD
ncbi:flagellar biosynthetic protein FliO [Brevibacillus fluminis]|nr:flagellar biosynthetic protein FliO [Brevibacillus fluminis]